ncbi:hypothetical protein J6590_031404 [Homalodisca vitripennis]|nr:hypothetical protein J6590_031404 [Homalodisca vitripennis]
MARDLSISNRYPYNNVTVEILSPDVPLPLDSDPSKMSGSTRADTKKSLNGPSPEPTQTRRRSPRTALSIKIGTNQCLLSQETDASQRGRARQGGAAAQSNPRRTKDSESTSRDH